jgi:uncharacterized phage protein (TIGR02216 family)
VTLSSFRPHMEIALGVLGWSPETFWKATMHEFIAALDGRRKSMEKPVDQSMTRDEYNEMKRRFPDVDHS